MKRSIVCLLLALCLCLGLAACGNQQSQGETNPPANDPSASENTEPQLSGKVTVYMPSPAGLADKLAAAFTEKTGVEVEQFQGTTGEILARLEAEQANPVADVVILASWSDGLSMKAGGQLESYVPANADKINDGWIDSDNMLFGSSASAVGVIYNTTVVPELNADWAELADSRYKDSEDLFRRGKMELLRYPVHCGHVQFKRLAEENSFSATIPYHSEEFSFRPEILF